MSANEKAGTDTAATPRDEHRRDGRESVVVSREAFEERLRGRRFERWRDFREAAGPQGRREVREMGGEERFASGLSIAFVVILNVLIWALIIFVISKILACGAGATATARISAWAALVMVSLYGLGMYAYCRWAYQHPELRLVTNFLFGVVPFATSVASYILALLVLDGIRATFSEEMPLYQRLKPWEESLFGRALFFLAVWPGLAASLYLANTVSTGFRGSAAHIDVLSLCLFVDVGRFCGHLSYLLLPRWSIGRSADDVGQRPGLLYVLTALCLAWYVLLARLEAGGGGPIMADRTKVRTLVCLTSLTFFPLSLYLSVSKVWACAKDCEPDVARFFVLLAISLNSMLMLAAGVVFDALEPNVMGLLGVLFVVFYGATTYAHGSMVRFILLMLAFSGLAFGAVLLAASRGEALRGAVLAPLRP